MTKQLNAWYITLVGIVLWAASLIFTFNDFPWYAHLASGVILIAAAHIWAGLMHKASLTPRTLIAIAAGSALVLLVSLGMYLL